MKNVSAQIILFAYIWVEIFYRNKGRLSPNHTFEKEHALAQLDVISKCERGVTLEWQVFRKHGRVAQNHSKSLISMSVGSRGVGLCARPVLGGHRAATSVTNPAFRFAGRPPLQKAVFCQRS